MELIKVCGIVICAISMCMIFKNLRADYSLFLRILITIGISIVSISVLFPLLNVINEISSGTEISKYIPTLIKALGIALTVQITSDICRDSGEGAIAERVELFGKAEILVLCIPLITDLVSLCKDIAK